MDTPPSLSDQEKFLKERAEVGLKYGINPERLQKNKKGEWCVDGDKVTLQDAVKNMNERADQIIDEKGTL